MAGDEEARARATLIEMQRRITRGPYAALGIQDQATPEDVRAAFLGLTKQFHPARFGRMSTELQRMSNEVFLGIKAAHETMLRTLGVAARGSPRNQQSGSMAAMPFLTAEGSSKMQKAQPSGPLPRVAPQQPQRSSSPAIPRTFTPGQRTAAPTVPRSPPPAATGQTPPRGVATIGGRPGTPAHGVRTIAARPGTPPNRPATPQHPPPPSSEPPPMTERGIGPMPQKTAPVFDERVELKQVLDHMTANNWVGARQVLNGLAARMPSSKQYRALLCYTRGREAQLAGKGEEAVMELQRALQLDPDLHQAKAALGDLLRRR